MYGLFQIHSPLINNVLKLQHILSATYGWTKFFVPLLKYFTMNENKFMDSFEFANLSV